MQSTRRATPRPARRVRKGGCTARQADCRDQTGDQPDGGKSLEDVRALDADEHQGEREDGYRQDGRAHPAAQRFVVPGIAACTAPSPRNIRSARSRSAPRRSLPSRPVPRRPAKERGSLGVLRREDDHERQRRGRDDDQRAAGGGERQRDAQQVRSGSRCAEDDRGQACPAEHRTKAQREPGTGTKDRGARGTRGGQRDRQLRLHGAPQQAARPPRRRRPRRPPPPPGMWRAPAHWQRPARARAPKPR